MINLIGVIGAGQCNADTADLAYAVGREIAGHGFGLVCGGLGGVMEAACKGCKEAGGLTVGIIPQDKTDAGNKYLDIIIPSGMGIMRNLLVVRSAVGLIAVSGRYGTLSEIAFALQLKKPLVALNSWDVSEEIIKAQNPQQAVERLLEQIK